MSVYGVAEYYEHADPDEGEAEPQHEAELRDELPALDGSTILLVEDDELSREGFELVFSYYGARVLSAESTAEALAQYERGHPAVLVSDIGLPDVDGCVLLRTIRAREDGGAPLPAIAISGSLGADANRRAHAAGFDVFLAKPINISVLLHAIQNLLVRGR